MSKRKLEIEEDESNKKPNTQSENKWLSVSCDNPNGNGELTCFYEETPISMQEIQRLDEWSCYQLMYDIWKLITPFIPHVKPLYILESSEKALPKTAEETNLPEMVRNGVYRWVRCSDGKSCRWSELPVHNDTTFEDMLKNDGRRLVSEWRIWSRESNLLRLHDLMTLRGVSKSFSDVTGQAMMLPRDECYQNDLEIAVMKVITHRGLLLTYASYRDVELEIWPSVNHAPLLVPYKHVTGIHHEA